MTIVCRQERGLGKSPGSGWQLRQECGLFLENCLKMQISYSDIPKQSSPKSSLKSALVRIPHKTRVLLRVVPRANARERLQGEATT